MLILLAKATCVLVVSSATPMKLKSVTLYKNGIGYFEREAKAAPNQELEIPLGPGQLSDAVKSLVVLGERPMASVDYSPPSSVKAEKARLGKSDSDEDSSRVGDLPELANELRGEQIEVQLKNGTRLVGKVVEVSTKAFSSNHDEETKIKETATLMLSGAKGVAAISFDDIEFIKPLNPARQQALERLAAAEGAATFQQNLKVRAGKGDALLKLGYLTEAPVWSISYRLSVRGDKARLQAFAQVHNDSDEAWDQVELTVATGEPISLLMPIAGPRYSRREVMQPSDNLDDVPQLVTQEARSLLNGEKVEVTRRDVIVQASGGLGVRGGGMGVRGSGSGVYLGSRGREFDSISRSAPGFQSDLLQSPWAPLPAQEPEMEGDYTVYRAHEKISLKAHSSALVPILDVEIPAQWVVIAQPLETAVRFVNETRFPLEPGPMAVFDGNVFMGDTSIDKIWPKSIRVLEVAPALDIEAQVSTQDEYGPIEYIRQEGPQIFSLHRMNTKLHSARLKSQSRVDRTILLKLPVGYRLKETDFEEIPCSSGQPRFVKLLLKKGAKLEVTLHDVASIQVQMNVSALNRSWLSSESFARGTDAAKTVLLRWLDTSEARSEVVRSALQREQENAQSVAAVKKQLDVLVKYGARSQIDSLAAKLVALEEEQLMLQKKTAAANAEKANPIELKLPSVQR